ncbi:MAG: hypothetical protein ABI183_13990 [Polyangiaceae bacterium]
MTFRPLLIAPSVFALIAACGGSTPPPATTPPTSSGAPDGASSSVPAPSGSAATTGATTPTASDDPGAVKDDATESSAPIPMTALVTKSTPKSSFPKAKIGDHECWQNTALAGKAKDDFQTIIDKCGTPTGLMEYAKPVQGKLHSKADKRDTYILKLMGGYCYRYFAVGDGSIKDLDILVEKPDGALVAADKTDQPFAIIDSGNTWCMDQDAEYHFAIEVDGVGKGSYFFGVWAKPKGK